MRRHSLPPPRPALLPARAHPGAAVADAGVRTVVRPASETGTAIGHHALPAPSPARATLRRFFDPETGWVRCTEREANKFLSQRIYPRIPWIDAPYSAQLARALTVSDATVELPGLDPALAGLTALLITDVHVGPFLRPRALESAFDRLLGLEPDVILIGGDIATSRLDEFQPFGRAFRRLRAPLGVFAVLGNHDHYTEQPDLLRRQVERTGVRFLHNDAVVIERHGGRLVLAGIDDLLSGRPDLDAALSAVPAAQPDGSGPPVVLLSHNPDVFFEAARRGVSLVLSGHTHGGQVRVPGLPVLVRQSRFRLDAGRYAAAGCEIVVSRGLGVTGLPFRIACAPEAVLVELA